MEPMAARLGKDGNRQALAHFVTSSPWDAAHVRARLAWRMEPVIKPTVLVIDDTGFLKDGDASACVGRQYTGTAGEVTNCQAGGSLHLASNGVSVAVNWRLFLPGSWDLSSPKADPAKAARRDECAISAQVGHVEKWQLTLDMIDETRSWGIDVPQSSPTAATVTPPPSGSAWRHADSTTWWASRPQPPHDPRTHGRRPRPGSAGAGGLPRARTAGEGPGRRGWQIFRTAGAVEGRISAGQRPQRGETHTPPASLPCGSGPPGARSARPRPPPSFRSAGGVARRQGRARAVLALQPARNHPAARPRAHRETPLAHRERLS
nr:transposase [Streptomyces sp. PgraA7]